jgi:hypothetical protein
MIERSAVSIAAILMTVVAGTAAAAPLVPPSEQPGRERERFTPQPLDRFMQPTQPAEPLLRWDCDPRRKPRGGKRNGRC